MVEDQIALVRQAQDQLVNIDESATAILDKLASSEYNASHIQEIYDANRSVDTYESILARLQPIFSSKVQPTDMTNQLPTPPEQYQDIAVPRTPSTNIEELVNNFKTSLDLEIEKMTTQRLERSVNHHPELQLSMNVFNICRAIITVDGHTYMPIRVDIREYSALPMTTMDNSPSWIDQLRRVGSVALHHLTTSNINTLHQDKKNGCLVHLTELLFLFLVSTILESFSNNNRNGKVLERDANMGTLRLCIHGTGVAPPPPPTTMTTNSRRNNARNFGVVEDDYTAAWTRVVNAHRAFYTHCIPRRNTTKRVDD